MRFIADDRRTWSVYVALVALLTVVTFGSLTDLLLDTHEDEIFRDHLKADGLGYFFKSAAEKEFNSPGRPITEIARYLGYLAWGNNPGAFHLYCAAVHALASVLLALAARSLGAPLGLSLLGGLLFLMNVSHFRGVHYISGLDYPLAQVFSLGALLFFARYEVERHGVWLWGVGACLLLGTASHQAAVMVLPFLFYYSWSRGQRFAAALRPLVPIGLLLLLEIYLLLQITDREGVTTWVSLRQLAADSLTTTIPGMVRVLLWLTGRLFSTAHWFPLTVYEQQDWEIYFGGLVLAGLGYLLYRHRGLLADWALWIPLSLAPFIMISEQIHIHLVHGPSRHLYMASAGSSLLLAWGLQKIGQVLVRKFASGGYAFYGVVLLTLGVVSYAHLKKAESLSYYSIGRFYLLQGDFAVGISQLQRAIAEGADLIPLEDAYYRLCSVKLGTGDDGEQCLAEARLALPGSRRLRLMHSAFAGFSDDPERRRRGVEEMRATYAALEREKRFDAAAMTGAVYYNIGLYFSRTQDVQKSVGAYRQALAYDRAQPNALFNLAVIYNETGQSEKSIDILREARLLAPQNAAIHALLGEVLFAVGSVDAAIVAYQDALDLAKDDAAVYTNLGWALYTAGRVEEAIEHYLYALRGQSHGVALFNLGLAYLAQGDIGASQQTYARAVAEYGSEYGEAIGAVADLRALAAQGAYVDAAGVMLSMYWPQ
ncbi:MAG: tetratricopeptide repeat protein [Gemmatimonadetes bacterium]|jgi:tetratricopeptide (TPR) repeat protein|nr:tetratricopeptide repeat protein [Gemmatimonadota bacterium]MBT6619963.1 tetratricopeptide repeat protein [Gemmatimonadota bacterium]MBT6908250.1 tetratricopeptide repeat protein [Gemmatimonadota bacterium]